MNTQTRVRFAPSPTGYLHIGGARTALFNWLFAQQMGGQFLLRIEDTDQERNTPESLAAIYDSLHWLGLDWDEEPLFQSERAEVYRQYANLLVDKGLAYRCYATAGELEAARQAVQAQNPKAQFRYPGWWRDRTDYPAGGEYVVRFKTPESGTIVYQDKVFGQITTQISTIQDFILMRTDGIPLYNFANVVDDWLSGITTVIRGRDHMINTPMQILLYQALGAPVPEFAHLPMMLAPSGEKLSKRHGAVSVEEFKKQGIAPQALLNYLARFGWSHGNQEIFSIEELIKAFSWEKCNRSDGKFDEKKLAAINFAHISNPDSVSDAQYLELLHQQLNLEAMIPLVRKKIKSIPEALVYLSGTMIFNPAQKLETGINWRGMLEPTIQFVATQQDWTIPGLRVSFDQWLAENKFKLGLISQTLRLLLTNREVGPELFGMLSVLGQKEVLKRLNYYTKWL